VAKSCGRIDVLYAPQETSWCSKYFKMGEPTMQLAMGFIKKGINAFQLKLIALVFMTIDHIAVYQIFTRNSAINDFLRILGRIAAPLFLFLLIEGLRHTRSKWKYTIRLYIAAVIIQVANLLFLKYIAVGHMSPFSNVLPTFTYTALYITCIELLITKIKSKEAKKCVLPVVLMIIPFIFVWVNNFSLENGYNGISTFVKIFAPSPFVVEYSFIFVLLGIAWYFTNNKTYNCILYAMLCAFCCFVPVDLFFTIPVRFFSPVFFNAFDLFMESQWCMCFAIPFIVFYNGEKGRSCKYLFYGYYPLHQYLLFILQLFVINRH
jgi:hypothetical protein